MYSNHIQHKATRSQFLREHDVESPFGAVMDHILIQSVVDVLSMEDEANEHYKKLLSTFLNHKMEEFAQFTVWSLWCMLSNADKLLSAHSLECFLTLNSLFFVNLFSLKISSFWRRAS